MAKGPSVPADNDIYTILTGIALALVLGAIVFVMLRSNEILGTVAPGFVF
jgi:hypothetical protein